ncbi:MAG TPA: T9SS type A sorting domain-containing protein [Candidatus Eisenbacteria bacterium]|jgi:hypothetical protein
MPSRRFQEHWAAVVEPAGGGYIAEGSTDWWGYVTINRVAADTGAVGSWPVGGITLPRRSDPRAPDLDPGAAAPSATEGIGPGDVWPALALDGRGGLLVSWSHVPSRHSANVRVIRLSPAGVPVAGWPVAPSPNSYIDQARSVVCSDGAGGAFVAWVQGEFLGEVQLHHVLADGTLDPRWPLGGLALDPDSLDADAPGIVPDGAGGAFVVWQDVLDPGLWQDFPNGVAEQTRAQHVLANGTVAPGWPTRGMLVCSYRTWGGLVHRWYGYPLTFSSAISDGNGGVFVAWTDFRKGRESDGGDVYVQRLLPDGRLAAGWPADGLVVCDCQGAQTQPYLAADGEGGLFVAWQDERGIDSDIYAQHVTASGTVPESWPANGLAICTIPGAQEAPAIAAGPPDGAFVTWADRRAGAANVYGARIAAGVATAIDQPPVLALSGAAPNPVVGDLVITFSLADDRNATIELLDVAGRRVLSRPVGAIGRGRHSIVLASSRELPPGVYVLRLAQGSHSATAKIVIAR